MREILTIHLGQTGVGVGTTFWEHIAAEHYTTEGIDYTYDDGCSIMFAPRNSGKFLEPRALFIDSDTQSIDDLRQTFTGSLMSEGQLIAAKEDSASVYARGKYCSGPTLVEEAMERVRRMAEECTALQGFYIQHATAGGTGSALTDLLLQRLADEYRRSERHTISVYPGDYQSQPVVSPYNVMLSSHSLIDHSAVSLLYDNRALTWIARRRLDIFSPSLSNLNEILVQGLSSLTESMRFAGSLNSSMDELNTSLVFYPRVHLVLQNHSPFLPAMRHSQEYLHAVELAYSAIPDICLASCSIDKGKSLACSYTLRGSVTAMDLPSSMIASLRYKINYVYWAAGGYKCGLSRSQMRKPRNSLLEAPLRSISVLTNSTDVKRVVVDALSKAEKMYKKRAFVHWFVGEGMEEGEFSEAIENLQALVCDYEECEAI